VPRNAAKKSAPRKTTKPTAKDVEGSKSARTRARILDAAAHVMSRKGYAGTRLSDVAEQAEIQAPAIYYYYSSREDLIEEVMFSGISQIREHVEGRLAELPAKTGPMERLLVAVEAHLRYALEVSDYTNAAVRNAGQVPTELLSRYDAENTKYGKTWRSLVTAAHSAGLLRKDVDPRLGQMLVLGALNWTPEWWDGKRNTVDELVATAQSIVRHGLGND